MVFTADNLGVAPHHGFVTVHADFIHAPLATGRVRFVGEPIALVLAETVSQAADAAALVWADYDADADPLVDPLDAIDAGATAIFAEHGSNQALVSIDRDAVDLEAAAGPGGHVVRGRYVNQRMAVVPMEPNGCVAVPEPDGRLTFYASTQMPHGLADQLAGALAIERDAVRVVTPQVGGGFGGKAGICPEYSAVAGAARSLGRPVTWVPTRSEDLVSLPHSRAQVQHAELAVDADGRFRALRVRLLGDAGAYPSIGAYLPGLTKRMSNGVYEIDAIQFDVAVAVTNTTPTGAYRGAGRPEATALLERLVGQAALELDIDPIELRRRNLIAPTAFPFTAHSGAVYDSGNYVLPLDVAADAVGYVALREEQARRRAAGDRVQLGIGVATYVEITAGGDDGEFGALEVHEDGSATVRAGTLSHGQGHQTAYAMLVHDRTGIPVERITLVDGDTDLVPRGGGTGGSRSLQIGGSAVDRAAVSLVERARRLAASMLEADPADVVVDTSRGTIGVAGVPASALTWAELATRAAALPRARDALRRGGVPPGRGDVPVRRPHRRRRGRPRHRCRAPPAPRRGRRLRHRGQPAARRGPAARGRGGRDRSGAVRGGPLRRHRQPRHRDARRLRHPHRRRASVVRGAVDPHPDAAQPARGQGHRRGRHHRLHPGGAERRGRRAGAPRRASRRSAVQPATGVGDDPRRRGGRPARPVARAAAGLRRAARRPERCGGRRRVRHRRRRRDLTPMADDPATAAMKAKVLTVSDGVVHGTREDRSGAALVEQLTGAGYEVVDHVVTADGTTNVADALVAMADGFAGLIVTTGGTGFAPRDQTPEGTRAAIEREAPGLAEAMRLVSPLGRLSRGIAGVRGQALICNTPGSPTGCVEQLGAILDVLPHALRLLHDEPVGH